MFVKTPNATFIKLAYVCAWWPTTCVLLLFGALCKSGMGREHNIIGPNIIFKYRLYRPCKSLLTPALENVPKWMYRNGTYNVRSVYRSCTPICTEVVVPKWSAPCTEMVMYRTGPTPLILASSLVFRANL